MISKRVLKTAEGWLKKRDDLLEEERSALMSYVKPMKNVEALATTRWFVNEVIRVPEDLPKVSEAIIVAKKAKVDPLSYSSPMNILNTFKQYKIKEKAVDPDTIPELSNGRTVGPSSFSIRIYDVEDTKEGQLAMRKIINTHWGEDANPWCLLQGDGEGNLYSDAWGYWNHYNGVPKRVAFKDGKLLAFCANNYDSDCWWDRKDEPHKGIPAELKMPNDELGRVATYEVSSDGTLDDPINIHRGNKKNGVYEEWHDDGQLKVRENYKGGKLDGVREEWYENGQLMEHTSYDDGKLEGVSESWYENGQMMARSTFASDNMEGLYESWHNNGQLEYRYNYKDGKRNGLCEEWDKNGNIKLRSNFKNDELDGITELYYDGQIIVRSNNKSGVLDGLFEQWDENGKFLGRRLYKDGKEEKPTPKNTNNSTTVVQETKKRITLKPKKTSGIKI